MTEAVPRKVLVIAYFFPPLGGAGVQRVLKFVKYLPRYGFQPVVLTTRSHDYPAKDPGLIAEVPAGTTIARAGDPSILRWAAVGFDYFGFERLRALVAWPDRAAAWIPAATISAIRLVSHHRPAVIFSSAPPFSAHLVACLTARITGLPWVADFRDEFAANPRDEWQTELVSNLNRRLERRLLAAADRVVTAAPYFELEGMPRSSKRRATISNGVDPGDVSSARRSPPAGDLFRLSYVGTLYGERDLGPITAALRRLGEASAIDPARTELRLVGSQWLREQPDAGPVRVVETGYLSHQEAVMEMQQAAVLLFYVPEASPAPSGKIFEYLSAGRPILCVARRDNLAYRLVEEWQAGRAVEPGDAAGIEAAIADLYSRWHAGELFNSDGVREKVLERYSRSKLTGELAGVLDAAVAAHS